jgi:hypothetical protein
MPILLATIRSDIYARLNASTVYGTLDDAERWTAGEVDSAILKADLAVIEAITQTPGHSSLSSLVQSTTVAHGALLPARVGPIVGVALSGKGAIKWPRNAIERERTNPQTLTLIEPHYGLQGNRLFHNNASAATVDYVPAPTLGAGPQSPDQYAQAITAGALAELFAKEGDKVGAASHYLQMFDMYLKLIKQSVMTLPPLED